MPKTFTTILILLIGSVRVLSQDFTIKCGETEIDFENGNLDHFDMVLYCPYVEIDSAKLPKDIREKAKKYIIGRVGIDFYKKLKYYSSQVIDFKNFDSIKKEKGWISETSDRRVKYAIQYYFIVQDSMRYYLSIVFSGQGKIISKHQLPKIGSNETFDKIINVCDVKNISDQDSIFSGDIEYISLEYSQSKNSFVWRIEKPGIEGVKPRTLISRFLIINATNGKLIKRETEILEKIGGTPDF